MYRQRGSQGMKEGTAQAGAAKRGTALGIRKSAWPWRGKLIYEHPCSIASPCYLEEACHPQSLQDRNTTNALGIPCTQSYSRRN